MTLVQRGVQDTVVLNHLVKHATRLNTYASVFEKVHKIMLTIATLMNTAQLTESGREPRPRCSVLQLREEGTPKA